jgi:hypothetical protein
MLLVPENQVQQLLDEISSAFDTSIHFPPDPFLLTFYQDGTPAPTPLGLSRSREDVGKLESNIASPSPDHGEPPAGASADLLRSFRRFERKLKRASGAHKKSGGGAATKAKKSVDRFMAHSNWCEALKRGQRYLGLRSTDGEDGFSLPDPLFSLHDRPNLQGQWNNNVPLDTKCPAPYPPYRRVIFISIDTETFERNHNLITEVGVSTLDTADIQSLAPGHCGSDWMECIKSRHFRVREYQHLQNTTFCIGDPEKFLFGHSEFVSKDEVGRLVDSCFEPPYSGSVVQDTISNTLEGPEGNITHLPDSLSKLSLNQRPPADGMPSVIQRQADVVVNQAPTIVAHHLANRPAISNILQTDGLSELTPEMAGDNPTPGQALQDDENPLRDVVLVGHDLDGDLHHLSRLQSKVFSNLPHPDATQQHAASETPARQHIIESLDTARLYQALKNETNLPSLAKILQVIDRTGWHLHNGGNDARYTLEAMLGILILARQEDDAPTAAVAATTAAEDNTA